MTVGIGRRRMANGLTAPSKSPRRRSNRFRAQSIVELALAMPILLILLLGTVDVGRVFVGYIEMRNGVFEGARYGSRMPTDTTGITNAVMDHGVPSDTDVTVDLDGNYNTIGGEATITVVATSTFTPLTTGFLKSFFGIGVFHLRATATMQVMT